MTSEDIYHQYKKLVFNLALQYTNNIQDAEEVTQDVFVKVFDKINGFRQDSELKTWIYRITINQSVDYLKSKLDKSEILFSLFLIIRQNQPKIKSLILTTQEYH